eukprot:CAMPEP_0176405164 /NCGR_PEP_ID=MMETSP0127-20121128/192_1 /TAXON_ID=938130 /ORGANISM="Platyophrya macrostoma, Strain WH" /LENGTH=602 /DNA_ID=CAMNT_0017784205 /DNA_START=432 /DNA_END=2240 /DNA_ORIENTATION=-
MQCSAATTSNNIYFCRGPVIAALIFGIILLIVNVFFFGWLMAIWQLPWRYANINQLVGDYITRSGSVLGSLSTAPIIDATLKSKAGARTGSSCPVCKLLQADPLGPGEVCFWCDVARYAFGPFYIGVIGSLLTIILVFCLPLKPWFSDWYYAGLLVVPYVSYTAFIGYIIICRVSIVGDSSQKTTTFFQLAWVLRGRSIKTVFPHIDEGLPASKVPTTGSGSSGPTPIPAPVVPKFTEEFLSARRTETIQLATLDILPKEFRKLLQSELVHDEFVLWWYQPTTKEIIHDMKWLIHSFSTATALGVWLWIASSITDTSYPITEMIDSTSLGLIGTFVAFCGGISLLITIMGCSRLYVLTNRRLMIVSGGVLGAHAVSTELSSLKYASVFGYTEWNVGPLLTFSWETPAELRKMPPIATKAFAAIDEVDSFLEAFNSVAPRLTYTEVIRENVRHNRSVWRMHIFFNALCIAISPIVVIYSQIAPWSVSIFLLFIVWSLNVCIIQRGLRQQQITYAPLSIVQEQWSHWSSNPSHGDETFLSTLLKDGHFHWMNKPKFQLPSVSVVTDLADKVRTAVVTEVSHAAHSLSAKREAAAATTSTTSGEM